MKAHKLYIFGVIVGDEQRAKFKKAVTASDVRASLDAMPDDTELIEVHMSGPGGDIDEAAAIVSLLKGTGKATRGYIHGMAASALTSIASELDRVEISKPGRYMIHNPGVGGYGDYRQKDRESAHLSALADEYAQVYAKKTKLPVDQLRAMMDVETWMTADEALQYGFVDGIIASEMKISACADDYAIQLSQFTNTPDDLKTEENPMKNILAAVGLDAGADETTVIAKFNELKTQVADKTELVTSLTAKVGEKESEITALTKKVTALSGDLSKFQASDVRAKVQKETGYIVGAEANEKLNRRIDRYLAVTDEADRADAYEDLKAFCIANGVKAGATVPTGGERADDTDTTAGLIKEAETLASAEKITFKDAYMRVLANNKQKATEA